MRPPEIGERRRPLRVEARGLLEMKDGLANEAEPPEHPREQQPRLRTLGLELDGLSCWRQRLLGMAEVQPRPPEPVPVHGLARREPHGLLERRAGQLVGLEVVIGATQPAPRLAGARLTADELLRIRERLASVRIPGITGPPPPRSGGCAGSGSQGPPADRGRSDSGVNLRHGRLLLREDTRKRGSSAPDTSLPRPAAQAAGATSPKPGDPPPGPERHLGLSAQVAGAARESGPLRMSSTSLLQDGAPGGPLHRPGVSSAPREAESQPENAVARGSPWSGSSAWRRAHNGHGRGA